MIVNIRGTSGSGKSYIVNRLVELHESKEPFYANKDEDALQYYGELRPEKPRKQPLGYFLHKANSTRPTVLLGHYEAACGGCDTIPSLDTIFGLADDFADRGYDVLFEGLLVSAERRRTEELLAKYPEHLVVRLATPLEQCVAGVQARRDARGDDRPLNPHNTLVKDKAITSTVNKLITGGFDVRILDRAAGLGAAREALNV